MYFFSHLKLYILILLLTLAPLSISHVCRPFPYFAGAAPALLACLRPSRLFISQIYPNKRKRKSKARNARQRCPTSVSFPIYLLIRPPCLQLHRCRHNLWPNVGGGDTNLDFLPPRQSVLTQNGMDEDSRNCGLETSRKTSKKWRRYMEEKQFLHSLI